MENDWLKCERFNDEQCFVLESIDLESSIDDLYYSLLNNQIMAAYSLLTSSPTSLRTRR